MKHWIKNGIGLAAVAVVAAGTGWAVQHYHEPGQLDVLTTQAMDMSQMRPPTGVAPVALASLRLGSLADTAITKGIHIIDAQKSFLLCEYDTSLQLLSESRKRSLNERF